MVGYGMGILVAVLLAPRLLQIHAYPILSLIPWAVSDGCGVQRVERDDPLMAGIENGSWRDPSGDLRSCSHGSRILRNTA